MEYLFGILLGVVFFGGIGLGIYHNYIDYYVTPKNELIQDKKLSDFKFQVFIKAINEIFPKSIEHLHSEFKTQFKEQISNGVDNIGYFLYSIEDNVQYKSNSVGQVKIHKYTYIVECQINKKTYLEFIEKSTQFDNIDKNQCSESIKLLKEKILFSTKYLDAIEVNKIN